MSYKPFTTEYTCQIIDDIKEYLEETNKDQTTLDTLDLCHLVGEIERLKNQLQQKENIIKEVREKLLCYGETFDLKVHQQMQKELLEILDKVD